MTKLSLIWDTLSNLRVSFFVVLGDVGTRLKGFLLLRVWKSPHGLYNRSESKLSFVTQRAKEGLLATSCHFRFCLCLGDCGSQGLWVTGGCKL